MMHHCFSGLKEKILSIFPLAAFCQGLVALSVLTFSHLIVKKQRQSNDEASHGAHVHLCVSQASEIKVINVRAVQKQKRDRFHPQCDDALTHQ